MSQQWTEQSGEYPQFRTDQRVLHLGVGQPSPSLLPLHELGLAASRRLAKAADPLLLQYGTLPGYQSFRRSLASFLSNGEGFPVQPDELVVTGGISTALSLVAEVLSQAGDSVICGDPTYFLARGIFDTHRLRVVGVPVDDEGLDVEELERRLEAGLRPRFVYCMTAFHNPRGVCLSSDRARHLVRLAQEHDFVVVADEPYTLLHFEERPPACMASYDPAGEHVISLGSFSKLLGPGLRLGWARTGSRLRARLLSHGALGSGGGLNPVVASLVHELLDNGFASEHVARLRAIFWERAARLEAALATHLPQARFASARGGYFLWLDLGEKHDTSRLLQVAQEHGVAFTPGRRCAVERPLDSCLRLSFAFYDATELEEAVKRLAASVSDERSTNPKTRTTNST